MNLSQPQLTTGIARLKRARRRRARRGVALLMVMGTLAVLTVMLTEFQDATSAEFGSSVAARDQVKAEYAAKSAVNLSRLLLAAEPTVRTAVAPLFALTGQKPPQIPVWEFSDVILGAFGSPEDSAAFEAMSGLNLAEGRNLGLDDASFRVTVIDEDAKVNFNLAAQGNAFAQQRMAEQIRSMIGGIQYDELFEYRDDEGNLNDRQTICSALIDWVDPDTERNPCDNSASAISAGAEDGYYQLLDSPYRRKNAAFDSMEEVRLVRGIDDTFWRTFIQPDPDDPKTRVVTVWGTGQVNVNTANAHSLLIMACHKAVPETPLCLDPELKRRFLSALKVVQGFSGGVPVFSSEKSFVNALQGKGPVGTMLTSMGFPPVKLLSESEVEKAISVKSEVFSIYATGTVKQGEREVRRRIHAVVDMRGAPPPGTQEAFARQRQLERLGGGQAAPSAGASAGGNTDPDANNPYLLPSPGGSVIYYRVD